MRPVYCNKCKKDFIIVPKVEKLSNDEERVYFVCPHCYQQYTAYYSDDDIKSKQKKMRTLQTVYNNELDKRLAVNLLNRMKKLEHEIGQDMEKLKRKYEG